MAARVGYDPFFAWAKRTVIAGLAVSGDAFVAKVELVDEDGVAHGARELRIQGPCSELLDAAALAIAIAIDPQILIASPAPTRPEPLETDPQAPPAPPPPVAAPPREENPTRPEPKPSAAHDKLPALEASAGVVGSAGVAPSPAFGVGLGAALRWTRASVGVEARLDAPARADAPGGGRVSSWLALGAVVPCFHVGPAMACALGQVGSLQSSGEGEPATRSRSGPWVAMGARVGAEIMVLPDVGLRVKADALANLDRVTLELKGVDVWPAPALAASLGVDGVVHFR